MLKLELDFVNRYLRQCPFKLELQCMPETQRYIVNIKTYKVDGSSRVEDAVFTFVRCDLSPTQTGSRLYPDTFPPQVLCHVAEAILSLPMYKFIDTETISIVVRNVFDCYK